MLLIMNKSIFDYNQANGYDMNKFLPELQAFMSKAAVGTTAWDIFCLIRGSIHECGEGRLFMTMRFCEARDLMTADMSLPIHRIVYEAFPMDDSTEAECYWLEVRRWNKAVYDAAMLYAKALKTYEFRGHGNYSESFGWDDGMRGSLGSVVHHGHAWQGDQETKRAGYSGVNYPRTRYEGVYADWNQFGGSRNCYGYIIAPSRQRAEELMKEYCSGWAVTEYEEAV